jgi:hypothetical protein
MNLLFVGLDSATLHNVGHATVGTAEWYEFNGGIVRIGGLAQQALPGRPESGLSSL